MQTHALAFIGAGFARCRSTPLACTSLRCSVTPQPSKQSNARAATATAPATTTAPSVAGRVVAGALLIGVLLEAGAGPGEYVANGTFSHLLSLDFEPVNPLFLSLLAMQPVLAVCHLLLLRGTLRSRVVTAASAFFGYFALGPVLTFGWGRGSAVSEKGSDNASKVAGVAIILAAAACYAMAFAVQAPMELRDVIVYAAGVDLLRNLGADRAVDTAMLQVLCMALSIGIPLVEDMKIRGWKFHGRELVEAALAAASVLLVPAFGVGVYLLIRPDVVVQEKQRATEGE